MSSAKLYVGNLSYSTSESSIRRCSLSTGKCVGELITDRDSGRPKGFGFVEMATPEMADAPRPLLMAPSSTAHSQGRHGQGAAAAPPRSAGMAAATGVQPGLVNPRPFVMAGAAQTRGPGFLSDSWLEVIVRRQRSCQVRR